jgi:hypothetical protein
VTWKISRVRGNRVIGASVFSFLVCLLDYMRFEIIVVLVTLVGS